MPANSLTGSSNQTPKQAIEQIIGWAKCGVSYDRHGAVVYVMSAENVDQMADDILHALRIPTRQPGSGHE